MEAITRYLRDDKNKKVNEIAKLLHKQPSSISEAYKNSKPKPFKIDETDIMMPLSEFEKNPSLSVLETVVLFLKKKNLRFTEIAEIIQRDSRTIWTIHARAKKKMTPESEPIKEVAKKSAKPPRRKRLNIRDYIK